MNHAATPGPVSAGRIGAALRGYADIMVHLDGTAEDEVRLAHAEAIATRFGAHLTGLHTNILPDIALYAGEFGGIAIVDLLEFARSEGDAARRLLTERFCRLNVLNELRTVENFPSLLPSDVAVAARWADLFVASCPYGRAGLDRWSHAIESVLFEGGHAVYLVPQGARPSAAITTVLIGWVDTREAARAIAEALPMLGLASKVELLCVTEPANESRGGMAALSDIATHLDRHGITTTVNVLPASDAAATVLLDEARRISADLIVSGAYGHSRLREWILGGTTRDLIARSDVPILMAH